MRWRNLLILLLGHLVGSYAGAGLLILLATAVDHFVPRGFWILLKAAPVTVPRIVWAYVAGLDRPKPLAVLVVVLGYAAAFYALWKITHNFRVPASRLERVRGFEIALKHTPAAIDCGRGGDGGSSSFGNR